MRTATVTSRTVPIPGETPVFEPDEELEDAAVEASIPTWLRETPFWAVSAVLHLLVFAVLLSIVTEGPRRKDEPLALSVAMEREEKLPEYRPEEARATKKIVSLIEAAPREFIPRPEPVPPSFPSPHVSTPIGNAVNPSPELSVVGPGSQPDIYGLRGVEGPPGGEPSGPSEIAVLAALKWLARHQSPDGSWKSHDFTDLCTRAGACRCLDPDRYGDGRGFANHDVGVTGLAVLAFAGWGHTHAFGRIPSFRQAVMRALKYLLSVQVHSADPGENGRYGPGDHEQWIYDHAIATMAMGELLAMTGDELNLERSVTDAVRLCLHAQNNGYGWKYGIKPGRNDSSVTGWVVLALKTARYCNLGGVEEEEYRRAFRGALNWFDRATSVRSGKTGYELPGDEGSRLAGAFPGEYPYSKSLSCMTAVSVLCRLFSGASRRSPVVKRGVDILIREPPKWQEAGEGRLSTVNMYYWYYASYAMFQFGGTLWKRWNEDMLHALRQGQRRAVIAGSEEPDCVDGSWDPIGEWGLAGGRVYATAIGAMTLEVYYRFRRLTGEAEESW